MDIWPELRDLDIPADFIVTRGFRDQFLEACDQGGTDTQDALISAVAGLFQAVASMEGRVIAAENRLRAIDGQFPPDGPGSGGWVW